MTPSFDEIFAVMSAASDGPSTARVSVPEDPRLDDVATRMAIAVNVLLGDLATRQRTSARLAERMSILTDAARDFSAAAHDHEQLLDTVARRLASVVGEYCIVLLPSEDGRELRLAALHAPDEEAFRRAREMFSEPLLLERHPIARRVHESGEPFIAPVFDLESLRGRTTPRYFAAAETIGLHSLLMVPLRVKGESFGQLVLVRGRGSSVPFDEEDLSLARALAEHAALALANARSYAAEHAARDRYRSMFDNNPQPMFVADPGTLALIDANAAATAQYGYSRSELVEMTVADLWPPEDAGRNRASLSRPLPSGDSARSRHRKKDGTICEVEIRAHDLVLDGRARRLLLVNDVTDRLHDVRERKLADERKAAVVDAALDAVVAMDHTGAITEFNPAAERAFGYTRAEVLGRILADVIIPPRLRSDHVRGLQRFLVTGEGAVIGRRVEVSAVRRDGAEFPVELSISPVGRGATTSFVGFIRDISERKRSERVLAERMRVAALVADIGMSFTAGEPLRATLVRCCDDIVRNLEAALVRIWTPGATTRALELQASAPGRVDGGEPDRPTPACELRVARIAEEGRPYATNDVARDERVDPDWARCRGLTSFAGQPLIADGIVVGVMAVFGSEPLSDVALAGLAEVADAMALRIRGKLADQERAALEEQLRHAQKMEAVGRLAGGIAHDFNNVLSVVLSYAALIISDLEAGDPILADVEEIQRAAERAAALTRRLLMFSRQQVIAPKVLDLNELLAGMDKMLRRLVGEDVVLTCVAGPALGHVRVDPGSIEQVVMNLAVNARDAMPTGGKLTLETANVVLDETYAKAHLGAKPGSYVMLSVTDTGTGIDKATLARIFEPFFTTKELGKGTGLGLSTVFGIVQQSGGSVWVYSELGLGTTFKMYLPRVAAVAEARPAQDEPTIPRGSETILLVEDEQQVREVAHGILRRHGYTVVEATNGAEALLLCEAHTGPIHLLLSDVVMPGMSGPALAKRLAGGRPDMKVLCMSGYTDDAAVRHGVIEAAFAYLQKPFTLETLTRKVREVLDAKET